MDRSIIWAGAIPRSADILLQNRNTMIGLAKLAAAVMGTSTVLNGLACTPTGPASMQVRVGPGEIYALSNVDATSFGALPADTSHQVLKQGITLDGYTLSCPAPTTSGFSVNYLVQVAFSETDGGDDLLLYYNADDPAQPFSGPGNTGDTTKTLRQNLCLVSVKAGVPAATGTQVTPAPDAGYIGAHVVTVAYGQTTIGSGSIATYAGAPFLTERLGDKISQTAADQRYVQTAVAQSGTLTYAAGSGTANAITASLTPAISTLTAGMSIRVKAGTTNTGAATLNLNGLGSVAIMYAGAQLLGGEIVTGQIYTFVYDGVAWQFQSPPSNIAGTFVGEVKASAAATVPLGYFECDGAAVSRTAYSALFAAIGTLYGAGNGTTTFNLPDYRGEGLRGWDHGRGVDAGRALGSAQLDAMQGHVHSIDNARQQGTGSGFSGTAGISPTIITATGSPVTDGSNGTPRVASETRGRNVAVMYVIKY